jgi:sortase A
MVKFYMTKRLRLIVILLLMLVGITQVARGGWIYAKASLAQYLLLAAWEQTLHDKANHKPWSWADTWPVARLQAPRLAADVMVLYGDHGEALAFGPGHHSRSAMPGTAGTILVGGHRDTHFKFVQQLQAGDLLSLQSDTGDWLDYRVTSMTIADTRTDQVVTDEAGSRLVLVTCWPFDSIIPGGPLRYVVDAEPVVRSF